MKKALVLTALALPLAGCQHRYVTVPCLDAKQYAELRAALPPKVGNQLTGDAQKDVRIIASSNVELRSYGLGLLSILEGCTAS